MPSGNGNQPRQLFLIDGNSLVYRAFFALPESIATSDGRPTNATFGFASMLVKLVTDHGVAPTVVVWDAGSSGRKEVYEPYKAQRQSRPSLLKEQWPAFEPLVEAFGHRNYKVAGFEADDVIATLAEQAKRQGIPVMVVTGDRDAFQIVGDGVRVMATSRGITETKVYGPEEVLERYGISHELIPDFYGLKGDSSDNIPGVPGIGDKTASDLLQRFGTLENVLASIDEISGAKRKENLTNHADDARLSKQLATAVTDVEVEIDLDACVSSPPDRSRLRDVFREFELREPLGAPEEEVEGEAVSSHLKPLRFAVYAGGRYVLTGETETHAALTLAWGDRPVVAHDWKTIATGEDPADAPPLEHDTMVAAYLLDPAGRAYPLIEISEREGIGAEIEAANGSGLAERAVLTRALAERQRDEIEQQGLMHLFRDVELPLVDVLVEMERVGVKLDTEALARISAKVEQHVAELERELWDLAGEEF